MFVGSALYGQHWLLRIVSLSSCNHEQKSEINKTFIPKTTESACFRLCFVFVCVFEYVYVNYTTLFVFDRNSWYQIIVYTLLVLDKNTLAQSCVQIISIR